MKKVWVAVFASCASCGPRVFVATFDHAPSEAEMDRLRNGDDLKGWRCVQGNVVEVSDGLVEVPEIWEGIRR